MQYLKKWAQTRGVFSTLKSYNIHLLASLSEQLSGTELLYCHSDYLESQNGVYIDSPKIFFAYNPISIAFIYIKRFEHHDKNHETPQSLQYYQKLHLFQKIQREQNWWLNIIKRYHNMSNVSSRIFAPFTSHYVQWVAEFRLMMNRQT